MRILRITVVCLLLVSFQANVVANGNGNMTDANYDPVLDEVIDAENPEEVAEREGIPYEEGSLRLVVELHGDDIPAEYDLDVVQKTADSRTLEAWVPVGDVSDIASEEEVRRIRQPLDPVPVTSDSERVNDTDGLGDTDEEQRPNRKDEGKDGTDGTDESDETDGDEDGKTEGPDGEDKKYDEGDTDEPLSGFTPAAVLVALLLVAAGAGRRLRDDTR